MFLKFRKNGTKTGVVVCRNLGNKPNQSSNNKPSAQFNVFSNDGSFLDQFKQMNDTKKSFDQKITISSIKSDKVRDNQDRIFR